MNLKSISIKIEELEKDLITRMIFHEKEIALVVGAMAENEFIKFRKEFFVIKDCHLNQKSISREFTKNKLEFSKFFGEIPVLIPPTLSLIKQVKELHNAYKVHNILESSLEEIPADKVFDFVLDLQHKISSNLKRFDDDKASIQEIIKDFFDRQQFYQEKFKQDGKIIGIPTGFDKLDNVIDGLRPEHLWVLGGYTNMGKTSASLNIVADLVRQGKRVVYYSLEMGAVDILQRLLGILTNQNGLDIIKGFGTDVATELDLIKKSGLTIHSFNSEISEMIASMFEENLKQPVDLFVVDFIQLVNVKGSRSEYETVSTAILELQKTAKRFKTPIIVLSQISNDGARNQDNPVMSFKGSGSIAAAADLAIEIKSGESDTSTLKEKLQNNQPVLMKWDVRKNRHGRVGVIDMVFDGKTGIFKIATNDDIVPFN